MKLGQLLLGTTLIFAVAAKAQDDPDRECKRNLFLAGEAIKVKNFKEAASYYYRGETICNNYDTKNYSNMLSCYRRAYGDEQDADKRKLYADTLIEVYERAEEKGLYDAQKEDLKRASYYMYTSSPDYAKADKYYTQGMGYEGAKIKGNTLVLYYYNVYTMYYVEQDADKKSGLKQRMIKEFFSLSQLVTEKNLSS